MNWKNAFFHALTAILLSASASIVYYFVFLSLWKLDYSAIVNPFSITGICTFICALMSLGYLLVREWKGEKWIPWLNILICLLSFIGVLMSFLIKLPLDVDNPEFFPSLVIPVQLFPVMAFLAVAPFFKGEGK